MSDWEGLKGTYLFKDVIDERVGLGIQKFENIRNGCIGRVF